MIASYANRLRVGFALSGQGILLSSLELRKYLRNPQGLMLNRQSLYFCQPSKTAGQDRSPVQQLRWTRTVGAVLT